ncbi:MAG: hypothetical protein K2I06_06105 [Ruminococcus sp.]|nr:hypothetical protein [Ruminococcus sp.]
MDFYSGISLKFILEIHHIISSWKCDYEHIDDTVNILKYAQSKNLSLNKLI